jgi:hypothetical protein
LTPHRTRPQAARRAAAAELICLVALVELIAWVVPVTPRPFQTYAGLASLIATLLLVCFVRDGVSLRQLGFRVDNFRRVLARLAPPFGAFILLLVVAGLWFGTFRVGRKFFLMLALVPPWALLQHYLLFAFAHRRVRALTGQGGRAVFTTAALFALLHLPNPALTIACALGGYFWAREYEREPNLYAHALTHTLASAVLANSLPPTLLKNTVVGYNYFFR